ncbi:MAG: cupin domain-containing protein [Balneolaceae bacterium]|nr:cupin domain-containing protein [Balneolaceae bacterium]
MSKPEGIFFTQETVLSEALERGVHKWISRPDITKSDDLMVVQVDMPPGQGHSFHKHPKMDEVIYVISGKAEQWIEKESKTLNAGDSVFIPKDMVHATFNNSNETLSFLAILSPATDYENATVDVFDQDPWKSLK